MPGLFVSEMITSRALVERNPKTLRLIRFAADERPRSLQLYGVDPAVVGAAVRMIVEEDLADHVDLNFGCPVPKVTRKGGGAALPWRIDLFSDIVRAAVRAAAGALPVTVKMRLGIDADHLTYREAGLRAQDAGVAYVALHGRTASDFYGGQAGWDPIAELARAARHPGARQRRHLGGRRRAAHGRADRMCGRGRRSRLPRPTVAVRRPRGRLRRPRRAMATGSARGRLRDAPARRAARGMARRGARACADFRKHVAWYLKGFVVGGDRERRSAACRHSTELDDLLGRPGSRPARFPTTCSASRAGGPRRRAPVALPEGWLADRRLRAVPAGAELAESGG